MTRLPARMLSIALAVAKLPMRRRPLDRNRVRRILIAHYLLLGDTLLLAPLLAKLARDFPDAELTLLVRPALLPLFSARPWGVRALAYDPRSFQSVSALLADGPYDLAFALGDNRYAWTARAAGARWIVGFGHDRPAWKNWMLDEQHEFPATPAALADLTANLVTGPAPAAFQLGDWPSPSKPKSDLPSGNYAVLHVGASTSLKLWPPERWLALAERLQDDGLMPVWSAGPGEQALVEEIDPQRSFARYCGNLDLAGMWHLLAGARLLVCPDTGVAHLGKVVGTPTVVLFGPGSASIYGAGLFWKNMPYCALTAEMPCRNQKLLFRRQPAWVRRCGRGSDDCLVAAQGLPREGNTSACMSAISLEDVVRACREFLI